MPGYASLSIGTGALIPVAFIPSGLLGSTPSLGSSWEYKAPVTEPILDDSTEAPRQLSLLGLSVITVAIAGIGWSMLRMSEPQVPDLLSCSSSGSPFHARAPDTATTGSELSLNVAFLGQFSQTTDFCVFRKGRSIGRIRIAKGTPLKPDWQWEINLPLQIPPWGRGSTTSLPEAKEAFIRAWERFHAGLTPDDIAHWKKAPDALITRR